MNLPQLCIQRPVMTVLLSVACVIAGWLAYLKLPIAALPSYNSPIPWRQPRNHGGIGGPAAGKTIFHH